MIKIICINGAPGVGKDTAGKLLEDIHGLKKVRIMKFAEPLNKIAADVLNLELINFMKIRESGKTDIVGYRGCQVTLRQLLISISEDLIKPNFGKYWFASECAKEIHFMLDNHDLYSRGLIATKNNMLRGDELIVITDCGFQYEFDRFKELMEGVADVCLIHMTRTGHTFEGDSRHKVTNDGREFYINNDGTIDELGQLLAVEFFS